MAFHTSAGYVAIPATSTPLQLAVAAGLGAHEKGDPTKAPIGAGYSTIKYVFMDGVS